MDHETRLSIEDVKREIYTIKNKMHRFADQSEIGRINTEIMNMNMSFASISWFEDLNNRLNFVSERLDNVEAKLEQLQNSVTQDLLKLLTEIQHHARH